MISNGYTFSQRLDGNMSGEERLWMEPFPVYLMPHLLLFFEDGTALVNLVNR